MKKYDKKLAICFHPFLTFERDSEHFWKLLNTQMALFNEKGLWGTIITTTHAPDKHIAWDACKDLYIEANNLFLYEDLEKSEC